jgi:hypothetical protein
MGEPVRREKPKGVRGDSRYTQTEPYAADVLLIAEPAGDRRTEGGNGGNGNHPAEPLDMENVVRKLIALLSEQQE